MRNRNNPIALVHDEKRTFKCIICDANFFEKGHLNKHIASEHNGKKAFKCNLCKIYQENFLELCICYGFQPH